MSEKEKMQSEDLAKALKEHPAAKAYLAGVVQGMKLARTAATDAEQTAPEEEGAE